VRTPPPRVIVSLPVSSGGLYSHVRNVMPHLLRLRPEWDFELHAPEAVLSVVFGRTDEPWMRPWRGGSKGARAMWEFFTLPGLLRRDRKALAYAPVGPFWNVRLASRAVVRLENLLALLDPDELVISSADVRRLRILRRIYLANARRARRPVCASEHSRERYVAMTGLPADRFAVIPHGVDLEGIERAGAGPGIADLVSGPPFILTVGQATPYRQTRELILAYRLLAESSHVPPPRLVWVGSARPQDEAYERECLQLLEPLRATGAAIHLPQVPQDQVFALNRAALLFVHPSVHEDCPNTIFEAMAAGAPVVCHDIPANREFVRDAAVYVEDSRPETLARVIREVVSVPTRLRELAAKGRARAGAMRWESTASRVSAELAAAFR